MHKITINCHKHLWSLKWKGGDCTLSTLAKSSSVVYLTKCFGFFFCIGICCSCMGKWGQWTCWSVSLPLDQRCSPHQWRDLFNVPFSSKNAQKSNGDTWHSGDASHRFFRGWPRWMEYSSYRVWNRCHKGNKVFQMAWENIYTNGTYWNWSGTNESNPFIYVSPHCPRMGGWYFVTIGVHMNHKSDTEYS